MEQSDKGRGRQSELPFRQISGEGSGGVSACLVLICPTLG